MLIGAGIMSAMRNTVSQLERDADALMEMIAPPSSRFRNQAERASQSSSSTAAAVAASSVQTDADSDVEKGVVSSDLITSLFHVAIVSVSLLQRELLNLLLQTKRVSVSVFSSTIYGRFSAHV